MNLTEQKREPGVYDISIEEYHNGDGISRSKLVAFLKSPLHFWHEALNPNREKVKLADIVKKTNALEFGNALHNYVLERNEFFDRYVIMPKINRATKAGKMQYSDFLNQSEDKSLLCEEAMNEIRAQS